MKMRELLDETHKWLNLSCWIILSVIILNFFIHSASLLKLLLYTTGLYIATSFVWIFYSLTYYKGVDNGRVN